MTENPLGRDFIRISSETTSLLVDAMEVVGLSVGPNHVMVHYRTATDGIHVDGFRVGCKVEVGTLAHFLKEVIK